ncbi:hypothetical protein DsansV1_C19g0162121 [Dioscorea sansibarensis]
MPSPVATAPTMPCKEVLGIRASKEALLIPSCIFATTLEGLGFVEGWRESSRVVLD